jgi:MEMO1 family protein
MSAVREAAVAGLFYPGEAPELRARLREYLAPVPPEAAAPKTIVVPHAGYVYSGPVAASAYSTLAPARGRVSRVVLLGPSHRVAFRGLALSTAEYFATPLGAVELDHEAIALLSALPQVSCLDAAHAREHSLEVQIPFLQEVLGEFRLVPLAVGDASAEAVAEVLECLWNGPETLIVVSTDLSHYLEYAAAQRRDRASCAAIEALRYEDLDHSGACGCTPLAGLLCVARRRGLRVRTLDLRNSGDTAGDRERVVGYGAWRVD